jgi:hypothetical protein
MRFSAAPLGRRAAADATTADDASRDGATATRPALAAWRLPGLGATVVVG